MTRAAAATDFRALARGRLPGMLFDYIDGGSYAERTLARNTAEWGDIRLRQRVLRDASSLSLRTELFGQTMVMPLLLAPVGMAGLFARRGEVQAARAAAAAGVPFCLSTVSVCSHGEVAGATAAPPWFQLYMLRDRGRMEAMLETAGRLRAPVLMFTVDLAVPGARYRDRRSGLSAEPSAAQRLRRLWEGATHPRWAWDVFARGRPHIFGNLANADIGGDGLGAFWSWIAANFDPAATWADLAWIRARWKGPLVLKGILDADDAREAVAVGADGIVVSNHGGRQLDDVAATAAALPRVVEAVAGRVPVLVDGGIRSGLDLLKALALGADAGMIGRPWAYALAAGGAAGVAHLLDLIRRELEVALALTGCRDVADAGADLLDREHRIGGG